MKKKIFLLSLCILFATGAGIPAGRKYIWYFKTMALSSFQKVGAPSGDSVAVALLQVQYKLHRDSIAIKRKKLCQEYLKSHTEKERTAILKKAGSCLRKSLTDQIYPCWYGTEWDFNGITETPCQGKIACGYFVSTTLKHAGINVNRYKLAQKYSHAIVKSVCTDVKVYNSFEDMITRLKGSTDDIYVVGLDNHVGVLSKQGEEIYFIHSSFVYPSYVQREPAESSIVLGGSNIYVLGNMTSNTALLKSWLMGTTVKVLE